ncbi:hypothetical protein B0H17DRAFT_1199867 [Mycena rosella]|uniref:Uncharacterized protein n=1 Tax=Mycena rosella TaxID=1033263 RepID=A0AAD7GJ78_MYCRO|nr:hypothetical protein B0H17DRAFT_1199867 [Mycena rosella]
MPLAEQPTRCWNSRPLHVPAVRRPCQFRCADGRLVSTFTSYGPTDDFYFTPAFTTPGGNILSTLPLPLGTWALESGVSDVLVADLDGYSVRGRTFAAKRKSASVGKTARTLFVALADGDPFQTVTQQGAGLVQVYDAVFAPRSSRPLSSSSTAKAHRQTHPQPRTAVTDPGTSFPARCPVPVSTDCATATATVNKAIHPLPRVYTLRPVLDPTTGITQNGLAPGIWHAGFPPSSRRSHGLLEHVGSLLEFDFVVRNDELHAPGARTQDRGDPTNEADWESPTIRVLNACLDELIKVVLGTLRNAWEVVE